jgi:plastocyanin
MKHDTRVPSVLVGMLVASLGVPGYAQDPNAASAASGPPTRAEFSKLQAEVREQRQLIIQLMQTEQQRYDMLLRLMQSQNGMAAAPEAAIPAPAAPEAPAAEGEHAARKSHASSGAASEGEHRFASVEGKVSVTGGEAGEVYVYIDNVRAPPIRNKTIEIRQEGKQFVPRVSVVQSGTSVVFPNFDSIYHNVFSNSPRNAFDLGSYRAGDKPRAVSLAAPGVVDVFCNMHQKMSASILVVPNPLYAKVKADGSFRLENVPVGARRIVAWSPNTKPAQQRVDVTAKGAQVTFGLAYQERAAHTNKLGQAYGSYRD